MCSMQSHGGVQILLSEVQAGNTLVTSVRGCFYVKSSILSVVWYYLLYCEVINCDLVENY
jgi:hypothetical protein